MFGGAVELKENTLCSVYVVGVDQRRIQCIVDGVGNTFLTGSATDIHDRYSTLTQRITHVRKVGVNISRNSDDLRYSSRCVRYYVIRFRERIEEVKLRIDLFEFLIIDDQQRIYMLRQTSHTGHRFLDLLLALESKRNRHDTHSEDTHFLCHFGYYGRSTRSGSTAHTGSKEQHLRAIIERLTDMIAALLGILTCGFRITTGA